MEDLGFTERWLVIDIQAETALDTWDGVEQVSDPARPATFMQVTGNRYRWEFQLRDGEDEAGLITLQALGRLLRPWTGRDDLAGLEIIRSAGYTFRARLAARLQSGRVFLLGDAAHLPPNLPIRSKMRQSAAHFAIPWRKYQLIGAAELAAAAGVLIGLRWHPLGVAAAAGMVLLLLGALITHRQAADSGKEMAPALLALAITLAYLAISLTS